MSLWDEISRRLRLVNFSRYPLLGTLKWEPNIKIYRKTRSGKEITQLGYTFHHHDERSVDYGMPRKAAHAYLTCQHPFPQ